MLSTAESLAGQEIASGKRFGFGANWNRYLAGVTEERIQVARDSVVELLKLDSLAGKSFLDIGCGSGLFSLAARQLGAKVTSFDFDPDSVRCTESIREKFQGSDQDWRVLEGSVLDVEFLQSLGKFDIVYSWGVLHHTGSMWQALDNARIPLGSGGLLAIAIYNDQGLRSKRWLQVKELYNKTPEPFRLGLLLPVLMAMHGPAFVKDLVRLQPLRTWRGYKSKRGMSAWTDVIDWVGGLPFEVASPEAIFDFFKVRGLLLERLKTHLRLGPLEYVFRAPA